MDGNLVLLGSSSDSCRRFQHPRSILFQSFFESIFFFKSLLEEVPLGAYDRQLEAQLRY